MKNNLISTVLPIVVLVIIFTVSWSYAKRLHRVSYIEPNEAVQLPVPISTFFGGKEDGVLNSRGLLFQLFLCLSCPIFLLQILNIISYEKMQILFGIVGFLLATAIIVFILNKRR